MHNLPSGGESLPITGLSLLIDRRVTFSVIILSVAVSFASSFYDTIQIHIINWLILAYFFMEMAIKVGRDGWSGYIGDGGNKFDFFILAVSIIMITVPAIHAGSIVYLRIFRILSLFKVVKLIPNTRHIITGLVRSIKAAKAVIVLLAIMLVFFALLGFTLFSTYLPEYFGDPLVSVNTVFTIFTVENWGAVPEAAKELNDSMAYHMINAYVITVLILGGFIAISLANAIFVDEMVSDNNDSLRDKLAQLQNENREIKELLIKIKDDVESR